jgi:preprotein translocase subunit YajC
MEGQGAGLFASLMPLLVLFAIFYFLIIRPQQKQMSEHQTMIDELAKGDKIVTNGGLIVEVLKLEETFFKEKNEDGACMK